MGRSVNYHSDSRAVIYIPTDEIDFDELSYLVDGIRDIAPSFQECKQEWHDREVCKFAENSFCTAWISEYCGLVSLSFVPIEESYHTGKIIIGLSNRWIDIFVKSYRKKLGNNALRPIGTFSNGERIFERAS
jgi:hypothetical protein